VPRKMSDRWLAANRENAQKSTGPRTPEGKARCAKNPCKHGILAKQVVVAHVDGADAIEFEQLLESLHNQFQPHDAIEHVLVDRVASCYWRLRRAQRYEAGALNDALEQDQFDAFPGRFVAALQKDINKFSMVLSIERGALSTLRKPVDQLTRDDRLRRDGALQSALEAIQPPAHDINDPAVLQAALATQEKEVAELEATIRKWERQIASATKTDDRASAIRLPLLAALPKDEMLHRLIRYETMLDRQLHRALRELRHRRSRRERDRLEPAPQGDQVGA